MGRDRGCITELHLFREWPCLQLPGLWYRAFGLSGTSFFDILFLQAVIAVAVDMLPLPGGMGISETFILNIFRPVFGSLLLPGMVFKPGTGIIMSELLISAAFYSGGAAYDRK